MQSQKHLEKIVTAIKEERDFTAAAATAKEKLSRDEEAEKKIRGRGSPARLREEQISPPVGPVEVGSADVQLRRLRNLVRRVQHLERLQRSAVRGQVESRRLWAKIRVASREVLTEEQPIPLLAQRQPPTDTEALADLRDRLKGLFSSQSA